MRDGKIVQYDTPENILNDPADKFTAEFIGNDRALKNLTRRYVKDLMTNVETVKEDDMIEKAVRLFKDQVYLWVTDSDGRFKGWISKKPDMNTEGLVKEVTAYKKSADYCISSDSTLKDALSKLVMNGVVVLPVTEEGKVTGEIYINSILETGNG